MNYATIQDGVIVMMRPEAEKEPGSVPAKYFWRTGDTIADGKCYRDGVEIPEPIPDEIPLWAFRAALVLAGITEAAVDSLISGLPQPAKTVASIQWNYGNFIRRDHPLIDQLGGAMGLQQEDIDNVFRTAATLV